jgi:transposase
MAASAAFRSLDLDEIVALAGRAERGQLAPVDGALIATLLALLVEIIELARRTGSSIRTLRARLFGFTGQEQPPFPSGTGCQDTSTNRRTSEPKQKAPGHGRTPASDYTGAKTVRVDHAILSVGQRCSDCSRGRLYDTKRPTVSIRLEGGPIIDATRFERAVLRCASCQTTFTAPLPEGVSDQKFSASADATIAVLRFMLGMPHYRLEQAQRFVGIPLPRSIQWERCEVVADAVFPVFLLMVRLAAEAGLLHADDTKVRILSCIKENKSKKAGERTGTFTTGVVAGPIVGAEGPRVALYFSGRQHSGENLAKLLAMRPEELGPPIRVGDAGSSNLVGKLKVVDAGCWAHVRTHFVEIQDQFPNECKHVLDEIRAIYRVDREARGKSPDERLNLHQQKSEPVIDRLVAWMRDRLEQRLTEPNSSLGYAFKYVLGHLTVLTTFLRVAGVAIDNNPAERGLRRAALVRRNSLFYRNEVGAWVGDVLASIGQTCTLHQVNPIDYLAEVVSHAAEVRKDPAAWLPWTYPKSRARAGPAAAAGAAATAPGTGPRRVAR